MPVDDSYTKLLLHMDGSDGAVTFVEESGKTITVNGNAQIDTAQNKFGGASGLFDGVGDYITVPDSVDFYFDGSFTVDFWARYGSLPGSGSSIHFCGQTDGTSRSAFGLYNSGTSLKPFIQIVNSGTVVMTSYRSATISTGIWYHYAFVYDHSTGRIYVFQDGVLLDSTYTTATGVFPDLGTVFNIGQRGNDIAYFDGHLDEIRISKGVARWTSNFTPPSAAYGPGGILFRKNVDGVGRIGVRSMV